MARLAIPAVGGASAVLAACSSEATPPTVVPLFSPDRVLVAGRRQRIPFAIVTPDPSAGGTDVALPRDGDPVTVTITRSGSTIAADVSVVGRVVNHDHVGDVDPDHQHANLFQYYPLRATLPEPGIYDLTIGVEGTEAELVIQAFDPDEVSLPLTGERFPSIVSPTFDAPDGVERICTRFEPCPFHTVSVDQVIGSGRPVAALVATPAFCSTAYCGPVLETLIEVSAGFPEIEFVHIEVYANPEEVGGDFLDPRIRLAPAVEALGLGFEPSLFLVSGDGVLIDRIDNVFDGTELTDALFTVR